MSWKVIEFYVTCFWDPFPTLTPSLSLFSGLGFRFHNKNVSEEYQIWHFSSLFSIYLSLQHSTSYPCSNFSKKPLKNVRKVICNLIFSLRREKSINLSKFVFKCFWKFELDSQTFYWSKFPCENVWNEWSEERYDGLVWWVNNSIKTHHADAALWWNYQWAAN
jgi:hypothetical protein